MSNKSIEEIVGKYPQGVNDRYIFSKISGNAPLPYLVEIQRESFKWFLEKGLEDVLREVFPISNNAGTVEIDYVSHRFDEPQHTVIECKEADLTYSRKLRVTFNLRDTTTGTIREGGQQDVFMGDVPMMTDAG
ncbi:MAG: DNA-directed RNA polymerase subunit beta, partial [Bacilli bacterium]|nr:DNA-directed RNA polymerase subunit beta [Bacilli bacterium]